MTTTRTVYVDKSLDAIGPWFLTAWKAAPGQMIAICDRCAVMLGNPMAVRNAAGQTITVGSDCAEALIRVDTDAARQKRELDRLASAQKAHDKQVRQARDERKLAELDALLADAATIETLHDWALFMVKASGATGRAKTLKTIKAALAE